MPNASIHRFDRPALRVLAGGLKAEAGVRGRLRVPLTRVGDREARSGVPSRGTGAVSALADGLAEHRTARAPCRVVPALAKRHVLGQTTARILVLSAAFTVVASLAFGARDEATRTPAAALGGPVADRGSNLGRGAGLVRFQDGSAARLEGEGTTIALHEVGAERIVVELDRGAGSFRVAARPDRKFLIRAGVVTLEVGAGEVDVGLQGPRTRVSVSQGLARIRWPRASATLGPGTHGTFPP